MRPQADGLHEDGDVFDPAASFDHAQLQVIVLAAVRQSGLPCGRLRNGSGSDAPDVANVIGSERGHVECFGGAAQLRTVRSIQAGLRVDSRLTYRN